MALTALPDLASNTRMTVCSKDDPPCWLTLAVSVAIGRLGGAAETKEQTVIEFKAVFDIVMSVLSRPEKPGERGKSYLSPADNFSLWDTNSLVNERADEAENLVHREVCNIRCVGHSRSGCQWMWKEHSKEYKLSENLWPVESFMPGDCHFSDNESGVTVKSLSDYYTWMEEDQVSHDY